MLAKTDVSTGDRKGRRYNIYLFSQQSPMPLASGTHKEENISIRWAVPVHASGILPRKDATRLPGGLRARLRRGCTHPTATPGFRLGGRKDTYRSAIFVRIVHNNLNPKITLETDVVYSTLIDFEAKFCIHLIMRPLVTQF